MGYVNAGVDAESAVILTLAALVAGVVIFVRRHWRERRSARREERVPLHSQTR